MPHTLIFESEIRCSVEQLWAFHQSVEALRLLSPPGVQVEILGPDTKVENGALHRLKIRQFGIPIRWDARISDVNPPHEFVDTAERCPLKAWRHHHEFLERGEKALLRDTVIYEAPAFFNWLIIRRGIQQMFRHRHQVTKAKLENA